jgi:hypothetical protein
METALAEVLKKGLPRPSQITLQVAQFIEVTSLHLGGQA